LRRVNDSVFDGRDSGGGRRKRKNDLIVIFDQSLSGGDKLRFRMRCSFNYRIALSSTRQRFVVLIDFPETDSRFAHADLVTAIVNAN
jgi:hypothetical protein